MRERAGQTSPVTRRSGQKAERRDEDPNNSARKQNAADTGDAKAFKGRRLDLDGDEQSSSRVPTVPALARASEPLCAGILAAWRASDVGSANRGALTNARKSEIRKELEETGMLDEFVRLKFPSLVPSFDADPELLQLFVDAVHVDHIVSSGCDFDENLWSGGPRPHSTGHARPGTRFRRFLPPRRLEFGKINRFFGENRAMPLKRERLGPFVWERVLAVFNRLVRKEAGVFRL